MIAKCRGPHYVGDMDVVREYDDGYSRWTRRRCPLCGLTVLWDEDNGIVVNGPEWRELAKHYPDNIYMEEGYEGFRPHGGADGARQYS